MTAADDIDWVGVYPPIGIARVGNATGADDYVLAAEIPGSPPDPRGGYQTGDGRIKRQAVRFRVYAKLKSGGFVELTASGGVSVEWRVHIANLKAGWYQFNQAMDLDPRYVVPARRRNAERVPRAWLDIRPAPRRISGPNVSGPEYRFRDGQFFESFVDLGEIRTDERGRLVFLGGYGVSAPNPPGLRPVTFANNDGWHDDVADGPVRATVTVDGVQFEADPGYVVVVPPNYAPGISGLVTMDDTVRETFMAAGWLPRATTTSFTLDVWPIFARLTDLQWVNHGLFMIHGIGSPLDARHPKVVERLADGSAANAAWRLRVLERFRKPGETGAASLLQLPYIYSDLFGERAKDEVALDYLTITPSMYAHLERWATGDFAADWNGEPQQPDFDELPAAEQVQLLARAGLAECLGGPFHPGIELSWPMRRPELWALDRLSAKDLRHLYRLNLVPEGQEVRQDYGEELTRETCLGPDGPTRMAGPGALTRWMGVPWQTDEASCNSSADYSPSTYLSVPSYWAARVPEQVLSSEALARARQPVEGLSETAMMQRVKHAFYREDWLRDVRGRTYYERIAAMIRLWGGLGIVEQIQTPEALLAAGFPPVSHVETGRDRAAPGTDMKPTMIALVEALAGDGRPAVDAGPTAAPEPYVAPRRSFGQGEV